MGRPDVEGDQSDQRYEDDRGSGQQRTGRANTHDEALTGIRISGGRMSLPLSRGTPIARTHVTVIVPDP
jgi:hypothetical protein